MGVVARLRGLRKSYGDVEVLKGFSLDVRRGECVGLLGPNGAGKTTTMKLITGQARLDDGELDVFGLALPRSSRQVRERLGVVTQEDTLDEELDCRQNLTVYASFFGLSSEQVETRADQLLAFVQLADRKHARVTELSGGMRRRLLVARALINEPELVLLDEPTTGLDPQSRQNVWQKVRQLKRQGTTLILTTHYMDEAEQLCDRLVILDRGRTVAEGTPSELIRDIVGREVIELRADDRTPAEIASRLDLGSLRSEPFSDTLYVFLSEDEHAPPSLWDIEGVESFHRRATLEDVFLRLTGRELTE